MAEVLEAPPQAAQDDDLGVRPAYGAQSSSNADLGVRSAYSPTAAPAAPAPPQETPAPPPPPAENARPQPQASPYAKPGPYRTSLPAKDESSFQQWVKDKKIPMEDDGPTADYDMRGYYQDNVLHPGVGTKVSQFDGQPHFPDTYKTPYHATFSNESRYATQDAPHWEGDRLVDKDGKVVADETPKEELPAGATGPLPGVPAAPPVDMKAPWYINPEPAPSARDVAKKAIMTGTLAQPVVDVAKAAGNAAKNIYRGSTDVVQSAGDTFDRKRFMKGLTETIAGGGQAALMIGAPELTEMASAAVSGDGAALAALTKVAASLGIGKAAEVGAGKVAAHYKLSPEAQELVKSAAFWAGAGLSGYASDIKTTKGEYGERGIKASVGPVSIEGSVRPAYRKPSPEGGYGEGSTVVPADVNARVSVGSRSVGTTPNDYPGDVRPAYAPPATPPQPPRELPAGERPVVQGSTDPAAIRESAAAQEKPTVAAVEKAVEGVEGASVDGSRVKDGESQANKAERDKPIETQKDHLGVRVAADTPEAQTAAIGKIAETMPVVGTEPLDSNGLKGTQVMVQTGRPGEANQVSEIQVVPTSQVEAMKKTDPMYDQQKEALAAGDTAKAEGIGKQIKEIHESALNGDKGTKKYEFGSTQTNIDEASPAGKALAEIRSSIDPADLRSTDYGGDGDGLETEPHVTVRYGIQGEDTAAIEKYLRSQSPFEAKLGKVSTFPANKNTEGAVVLKADIESPELHRMNAEIEKHGDFKESDFPSYIPHATIAYLKPEAADKYTWMSRRTEGRTFTVDSITVSDKNGVQTEIPLEGGTANSERKGVSEESPEQAGDGADNALSPTKEVKQSYSVSEGATSKEVAPPIKTGSAVKLADGRTGVVKGISPKGDVEVKLDAGGRAKAKRSDLQPISDEPVKSGEEGSPVEGVTSGTPGHNAPTQGAIAEDFDKTIAQYKEGSYKAGQVGAPRPAELEYVKTLLADGKDVWIFTARAVTPEDVTAIKAWTKENLGQELPITNVKYKQFGVFRDDRMEPPKGGKDASSQRSSEAVDVHGGREEEVGGKGREGVAEVERGPKPAGEKPQSEVQGDGGPKEKFKELANKRKPPTPEEPVTFTVKSLQTGKSTELNLPGKPKVPQIPAMAGMSPLGVKPELRTYEAEVTKFAGDPNPVKVTTQAENRRHAEQLLRERMGPFKVISGVERVAETSAKEENVDHGKPAPTRTASEPGEGGTGGGRPLSDLSGDRGARVEKVAPESGEGADRGRDVAEANRPDSTGLRENPAGVSGEGTGSGHGAGSSTELDNSPGKLVAQEAVKLSTKVPKHNTKWYTHPETWTAPTGVMGKLDANMAALRILRDIEKNPRPATPEEQAALANFVGWGALSNVFKYYSTYDNSSEARRFRDANKELRELLNTDEYDAASRSTQNAHYTSPDLVKFMWDVVGKRFGFTGGQVIEPSMGSGNFFGMMPKSIRSNVLAIGNEMEPVTAGIAKILYPGATIFNKDYVDLILPDNSLDLAISNVPFGPKVYDPKMPKLNASVHDYFFVKTMDKVRPGGVVAFITSTGTMDKVNGTIRDIIASKADLLGAIRLPSGAFAKNAGTAVTTDLIFLQKRAIGEPAKGPAWAKTVDVQVPGRNAEMFTASLNEYFHANPHMMLGIPVVNEMNGRQGGFALEMHRDKELEDLLDKARAKLPRGVMITSDKPQGTDQASTSAQFAKGNQPEGSFALDDKGNVKQVIDGRLQKSPVFDRENGTQDVAKAARVKEMIGVRDKLNDLLSLMTQMPDDEQGNASVAKSRETLKKDYDKFVKKNGYLSSPANSVFEDDPHYPRLLALENYDRAKKVATPADILSKRTVFPRAELMALAPDAKDALFQVLAERGHPDMAFMARLKGSTPEAVAKQLVDDGLIFRSPNTGDYQMKEKYLSGYVRDKLDEARAAVKQGLKEYAPNVAALEKVQPEDVPIKEIDVKFGATWIPLPAFSDFIADVLNSRYGDVTYKDGQWKVGHIAMTAEVTSTYGTTRMDAAEILEKSLNLKSIDVYDKGPDDTKVLNRPETLLARLAQQKLRDAFNTWAQESKKWGPTLEKAYNYAYNNLVLPEYDGSHLTFPGMNASVNLRPHQRDAIWRMIQDGRALLAHVVGAGKTFEMVGAIMEGRRVGVFKKPMLAVPNHLVAQWQKEFLHLYPGANILVPTLKDFDSQNRQRLMAKIATGDYDAVILAHSQFNLMDISAERQLRTLNNMMEELEETIRSMKSSNEDKRTVKQMEKSKEGLRTRMDKLKDLKADKVIEFDNTGVDALFVDEAHAYKNLAFYTKMNRVAGLAQGDAKRALRLKMKTEYLQEVNNGRGVVFATGTPIQNTMAEQYTMTKYVAPDVLERAGIRFFDDWAANFGTVVTKNEVSPDGSSFKARAKFAQFSNVQELMSMFRSFTDIKTAKMLNLPTPKLEGGKPEGKFIEPSDSLVEYVKDLVYRASHMPTDPRIDNMLKVVSDGRKAALDMRLVDPTSPDEPESKINQVVADVYRIWKAGTEDKHTQLVFLDMYRRPSGSSWRAPKMQEGEYSTDYLARTEALRLEHKDSAKDELNLYDDMKSKWIKAGIPAEQIAIIGDYDTDKKKEVLFAKMNSGEMRILMGSTEKMGAGMNVQRLLKALHHVDLPWRPGDLAQRTGRIERQGNLNDEVSVKYWLTQKSFDTYMLQALEGKANFIEQLMSGTFKGRKIEDIDSSVSMNLQDMKVATSGNPDVKLKYDLEDERQQLEGMKRAHEAQLRDNSFRAKTKHATAARMEGQLAAMKIALEKYQKVKGPDNDGFSMNVEGKKFTTRKEGFEYLKALGDQVPPYNFHMQMNDVGIAVKTFNAEKNMPVLEYQPEYAEREYTVPERTMESLGLSLESRLRSLKDSVESTQGTIEYTTAEAEKLSKMTNIPFSEQAKLDKVYKDIDAVDGRLGLKEPREEEINAEVDDGGAEEGEEGDEEEKPVKADKSADKKGSDLGSTFYSGLDPALFERLFPGPALRIAEWLSDDPTGADRQKAMMRETRGQMDRRVAVVMQKLSGASREWRIRSRNDSMEFWNAVEGGDISSLSPKDQALANLFKGAFDKMKGEIQQLKPEALQNYIENYFPHLWDRPSQVSGKIKALLTGKRPFAGKASFLKQRTIPTMQDGIDLGLTPKTWNPVESFLLKYAEMAQFLMGHQTLQMMKANGTAKYVRMGTKPPDGWTQLDDKIGSVYRRAQILDEEGLDDVTFDKPFKVGGKKTAPSVAVEDIPTYTGTVLAGHYYAPADAARVFNNFVSRGLAGRFGIYDLVNAANQNLNALQLGISAFHAATTTINAATSDVALGIQQLAEGKPFKAGSSFVQGFAIVPSMVRTIVNGHHLMQEYLTPGSYAKLSAEARALAYAGGRIKQNTIELKPMDRIINAWRNGARSGVKEGITPIPGAILQGLAKPIMEWYVPHVKVGAFYSLAHDVLDQSQRNGWDPEKTRSKMQQAWDSIDNRFGQVVYDNFFWNKALQDALRLSQRSIGWNFGDVRELGGGAIDTARAAGRTAQGEIPEVTPRMAFALALPMITALIGGVLTYLWTGHRPDNWKGYFYPKTADGTAHSIPGYMKDVFAFAHAPVQTVENKLAPLWVATAEAINNRDFYGTEIRHKDDPLMKQLAQFSTWAAEQAIPFSFSGAAKLLENHGADDTLMGMLKASGKHPGDIVLGQLGLQPAPAYIQNSPALNAARDYNRENRPPGTKTQDQEEHLKAFGAIAQMYRTGKVDREQIDQYVKEGKITRVSVAKAAMESRTPPIVLAARNLSIEQILNVYEEATDKEKSDLLPLVARKYPQIRDIEDPERKESVTAAYQSAMHDRETLAKR